MKQPIDWKAILTEEAYEILRNKGTEPPFSGEYDDFYEEGIYLCRACGSPLFGSGDKFKSGSGWPSFRKPIREENVSLEEDRSYGMIRTEALCALCEGHLGHFFPSEPRYCINSLALEFVPAQEAEELETIPLNHSKEEIALIRSVLEQEGIAYALQNEGMQDLFGAGRIGTGVNQLVGEITLLVKKKDVRVINYLLGTIF